VAPTIQQSVRFRTSPQNLYELYIDSKKHSRSTGAPARINGKVGGRFTAFGGQLEGKILFLARGKQIVQVWRASHWKKDDWSILVLNFSKVAGGAQIDLVHIGVPPYDQKGVRQGWPKYYWHPWKKFVSR
jgi:activator of HSP90 ATPase